MRRGVSRRAAVALLLAVPVATGSCAPRTLRADLLERRLARRLEDTLEVSGILVSCPDGVEVERGVVTECIATAPNGDRLRIRVTQVDDDGSVTWEPIGLAE